MSAVLRKGAGISLRLLQSIPIYRKIDRTCIQGIIVRKATPPDLQSVHETLSPGVAYAPEPSDPAWTPLVAVWHDRVIGYVELVRHPPSHAPYVGYWLFSMYVLRPQYRGLGIGETLTQALIEIAREEKARELLLVVFEDNRSAISLYEKNGFRRTYLDGLEDQLAEEAREHSRRRITMVKSLHE